MEYVKREPMKSESGREPTAFTMKSIKALLAEDQSTLGEAITMRTPLPKQSLQQPPHMRGAGAFAATGGTPQRASLKASAAPKIDADITTPPTALPKIADVASPESEIAPSSKKRSLFGRLIGS